MTESTIKLDPELLNQQIEKVYTDIKQLVNFYNSLDEYMYNSKALGKYYELFDQLATLIEQYRLLVIYDMKAMENIRDSYAVTDTEIGQTLYQTGLQRNN